APASSLSCTRLGAIPSCDRSAHFSNVYCALKGESTRRGGRMEADVDDRDRRIIADAIARGHTMARWIAVVISLLFIASGLWWAGILVLAVTTFELPRRATQRYLRKRGVDLSIPSAQEVEKTSLSGLAFGVVVTISWFIRRRRDARADDHAGAQ